MADGSTPMPAVKTTCPYCGVGCGVLARPTGHGGAEIAGDPSHPANFGRLCSKGSALGETLGLSTRLLHPEIGGRRVSWDRALDHVSSNLARIRSEHGPEVIAFYLSGQLLTEDYYVANKLAKGFIGTPHVDTNSRLCMASSVAGHKRAFGADIVTQSYEDLECADTIVLVGSNTAWCHPVLYQRIEKARAARGAKVVVIDPRCTATGEGADLHLAILPGKDAQLWNGLLVWLSDNGHFVRDFIAKHTEGLDRALSAARSSAASIAKVAIETGLPPANIENFYRLWAASQRVVSCTSQGVNQSAQGTDKVNAIINCHLATGRIGKPGSGPFSLTGQPNAMGGREVGGLANVLAAHMGFSPEERSRVGGFWNAPNLVKGEGLKAVDMFEAIEQGTIKALWVMGTNPAVSLPRADRMREALQRLELLVVSENVASGDTVDLAHVRLPACAWGEKDGTVTNSERRISRQRAFLNPPGETRPDWEILSGVASRLGWSDAFAWHGPADIFREHARLSALENDGARPFDLSGLSDINQFEYDSLTPIQWPVRKSPTGTPIGTERLFATGGFATPNGRARFIAIAQARLAARVDERYPFVLNTGRIRDQWHTMTRTGLSPRLSRHIREPFVEMASGDAMETGLATGMLAKVETTHGSAVVRVVVHDGALPGTLFAPVHWSAQNSSAGRIGALVAPFTDPVSGQPELKGTPARIEAVTAAYHGIIIQRRHELPEELTYWASATVKSGSLTAFALHYPPGGLRTWARSFLPEGEELTFEDAASGVFRSVLIKDGRLEAALFIGPQPPAVSLEWLESRLGDKEISPSDRKSLLAGRPLAGGADEGPIICACFGVGKNRIAAAISCGAKSCDEIGLALKAGTNCGSCIPELKRLLAAEAVQTPQAAE